MRFAASTFVSNRMSATRF